MSSELDDFVAALGGEVGGTVRTEGQHHRWTCECGETDTHLNETLASLALYTHRKHGHVKVVHVSIGE